MLVGYNSIVNKRGRRKAYDLYELAQKIRKIWLIVLFGLALTVLNSLITVSTSIPIIQSIYVKTLGEKADLIQKIESLVPGTNISYFKQKFNDPTFINTDEKEGRKDYVFVNKFFYLDATTDLNDKVLYYAVTTRDDAFNPTFKSPMFNENGDQLTVTLGKTRFDEITDYPTIMDGCLGAHDWFYYESYYLGNPGKYQTYAFGINMAGDSSEINAERIALIDDDICSWRNDKPKEPDGHPTSQPEVITDFRKNSVVNTYLVTEPSGEFFPHRLGIGVDYYQVRILD